MISMNSKRNSIKKTKDSLICRLVLIFSAFIIFNGCRKDNNQTDFEANKVYTTFDRTIIPASVASWPVMYPYEISKFSTFPGYGIWSYGPGLDYQKRLDLMSAGYTGASVTKSARLLNFFAITDVHITDEESPASALYFGYKGDFIAKLHTFPNLILWIAGHRHVNQVTPMPSADPAHPENGFWEVESTSLRDFPQQFRLFEITRNSDNTVSIITTNVDPIMKEGSLAAKSRYYAVAAQQIFSVQKPYAPSFSYNAELVKQLTPEMKDKIQNYGTLISN